MLEACEDALTLSTTMPLVPPVAFTAWETPDGNTEVMSKDMRHPALPVQAPGLVLLFEMDTKSRSVLLLKISVSGEHCAPAVASPREFPSVVPFMTPEPLKPIRYRVGNFEASFPQV